MKTRILIALGFVAIMLGTAAPAKAQVNVSGGWNFLHVDEDDDDFSNFPSGWYADVAARVAPALSVVGQITGNYKEVDEVNLNLHTYMGGARFHVGAPYVQALYGVVRGSVSFIGIDESESDGALQLGAGVDVKGSGPVGLRIGLDYIRAFTEDEGTNAFRFGVGISFGR